MPIKIVITDDHPLAIGGIQNMLQGDKDMIILNTYTSAALLLEGLTIQQPDVLLLDIQLPDSKGSELAATIVQHYPKVNIIVITSLDAPSHVKAMMRVGCKGYLLKNADQHTLLHAIREVHEGSTFIEPQLKEQMMNNMLQFQKAATPKTAQLSTREKEILQLIAEEYSNREIADKLFLSLRTVQNHYFNLQQKLEAKNVIGLLKIAIQMGLVKA
jgi:DNA-binding NarL/FixJ family response regulator